MWHTGELVSGVPPALEEHNAEQRPLIDVVAGVLEMLKTRAEEETRASGWCRGLHVMEPFFDAFQKVFEEVQLVQAKMDPRQVDGFTSSTNLAGVCAWKRATEEWRSSTGAGWRKIALSVHEQLSTAAEVEKDLAPIKAATRALALNDYAGIAAKYVEFVDTTMMHVAAFLERTQGIDVLSLASEVSMLRSGAPSVYDERASDETGIVPHNGVILFVLEALGNRSLAAPRGAGGADSTSSSSSQLSGFFVSGLTRTEFSGAGDAAEMATEAPGAGLSPTHDVPTAETLISLEQQAMLRQLATTTLTGSWKRDSRPGEDATVHTLAVYHHLGVGTKDLGKVGADFAAKVLAYITKSCSISTFRTPRGSRGRRTPGPLQMRFSFRSLGLLAKHSLFTFDFDLTRQNVEPVLKGLLLVRYWYRFPATAPLTPPSPAASTSSSGDLASSAAGGGCVAEPRQVPGLGVSVGEECEEEPDATELTTVQLWFEMFSTKTQRIARHCFYAHPTTPNLVICWTYLISPTDDGGSWDHVRTLRRTFHRHAV